MIPAQDQQALPNPEELAHVLGNYLELVKNHANELAWLLEQHASLRGEYITFFKKDLKEIEAVLRGLESTVDQGALYQELLKHVVETFNKDLERSYGLLNFTFFWKLAQMIEAGGSGYEKLASS